MLEYERKWQGLGKRLICGVDEVGRGPLAGPVCVTAVICDLERIVAGVNDSKKLTDRRRRALYPPILDSCICHKTVLIDNQTIDKINILEATKRAMVDAVNGLDVTPDVVLIDAVKLDLPMPAESIIGGDALSYSIACASVIAKVTRDDLMTEYAAVYPQYGFEKNMGYGTAHHIAALREYGATPIHRKTFIRNFVNA